MKTTTIQLDNAAYPPQFKNLHQPPTKVYYQGRDIQQILARPRLAVVGSRAITPYGKQVTKSLVEDVARQGVVIISGLAYGVDAAAHQATLGSGGTTVAVLPTPLDAVAPVGNQRLARNILGSGGGLLSTYPSGGQSHRRNFVERNQYVVALSQAVLIIEGEEGSGTARTVEFAQQLGVDVLCVPGSITSATSKLTNRLISQGATPITSSRDLFEALGMGFQIPLPTLRGDTPGEQKIIDLIQSGINDNHELFERSGQSIHEFNQNVVMLEVAGKITPLGGNHWGLA